MRILKIGCFIVLFNAWFPTASAWAGEPQQRGTIDFTLGGLYSHNEGDGVTGAEGVRVVVDDAYAGGFFGRLGAFVDTDIEIALFGGVSWGQTEITVGPSNPGLKWQHVFRSSKGAELDVDIRTARLGGDLIWNVSSFELLPNVNPYIGLGSGIVFIDLDTELGEADDAFPELHGIVGIRAMVHRNVYLSFEYQPGVIFYDDNWLPNDDQMQHNLFIGLTIFLD